MSQRARGSYAVVGDVLHSKMDTKSVIRSGMTEHASKLTERSGNVYENKGTVWKEPEQSGNVIENKGT